MSILFRNAHNIEHYNNDLKSNHDHQVSHLADEVAHNLRFADFGYSSQQRLGYARTELNYDIQHLSKTDFNREVAAIQNRLPNRDLEIQRDKHGDVTGVCFDGINIYEKHHQHPHKHKC